MQCWEGKKICREKQRLYQSFIPIIHTLSYVALIPQMLTHVSSIFSLESISLKALSVERWCHPQLDHQKSSPTGIVSIYPSVSSLSICHYSLSFFKYRFIWRVHNVGCVQLHINFVSFWHFLRYCTINLPIPKRCIANSLAFYTTAPQHSDHSCCCTVSLYPSSTKQCGYFIFTWTNENKIKL